MSTLERSRLIRMPLFVFCEHTGLFRGIEGSTFIDLHESKSKRRSFDAYALSVFCETTGLFCGNLGPLCGNVGLTFIDVGANTKSKRLSFDAFVPLSFAEIYVSIAEIAHLREYRANIS